MQLAPCRLHFRSCEYITLLQRDARKSSNPQRRAVKAPVKRATSNEVKNLGLIDVLRSSPLHDAQNSKNTRVKSSGVYTTTLQTTGLREGSIRECRADRYVGNFHDRFLFARHSKLVKKRKASVCSIFTAAHTTDMSVSEIPSS